MNARRFNEQANAITINVMHTFVRDNQEAYIQDTSAFREEKSI
jgi:hypothetical protein